MLQPSLSKRAALLLVGLIVSLTTLSLGAGAAAAQDDDGVRLRGTLRADAEVLPGVTLTVIAPDGSELETVVTDEDGAWFVVIDEVGDYTVIIDESTLPEGVSVRDGASGEVVASVDELRTRAVGFQLEGEGGGSAIVADPTWQRFLNRCVSGLKVGLLVALASVGLSLVFGVTGLVNFAHSELVTFGAVSAFALESWTGLPFPLVILLGVMCGGAMGFGLEKGLFRPLRRRKMTNISLMVVSIGLAFVLRYLILIYFGSRKEDYEAYRIQGSFDVGPISLPVKDYFIILIAFVVLGLVGLLLQRTKLGKAMRAVADNPPLAGSSGIDVDKTILAVWIWGSALAALGGIMLGMTQSVEWQMGERVLLLIFAAVTLGGLGTAYGAMLGGLAIGFASEVSTFWLDNDLKFLVALLVLLVILMVRPQGILGVKERLG